MIRLFFKGATILKGVATISRGAVDSKGITSIHRICSTYLAVVLRTYSSMLSISGRIVDIIVAKPAAWRRTEVRTNSKKLKNSNSKRILLHCYCLLILNNTKLTTLSLAYLQKQFGQFFMQNIIITFVRLFKEFLLSAQTWSNANTQVKWNNKLVPLEAINSNGSYAWWPRLLPYN